MSRQSLSELPSWPRDLSRDEAARYLGVSVDVFDDEVSAGLWPQARRRGGKGGRLTWDRRALDAAADRDSGLTVHDAPPAPPVTELWGREAMARPRESGLKVARKERRTIIEYSMTAGPACHLEIIERLHWNGCVRRRCAPRRTGTALVS